MPCLYKQSIKLNGFDLRQMLSALAGKLRIKIWSFFFEYNN